MKRKAEFTRRRLRAGWRRLPRRRPRDPEEERILLKISLHRKEAWLKSGRLEILGPRRYRLHVG
ncbi:MAG: hypothetical protein ACE5NP_05750 [Anaerolineae bacterium]